MRKQHTLAVLSTLLLALSISHTAAAQTAQWQPFTELQAGAIRSGHIALPTYGATLGLRADDVSIGLRYRATDRSPLHDSEPLHEVSILLQKSVAVAPRLELYGGVATGFAFEHARLTGDKAMAVSAELNLGLRYYLSDHVALTFNLGCGARLNGSDWAALAKQLPYDPRTIPTYTTATGGISIGIPPKTKKINLPQQLIVDGAAPILTAYSD